MLLTVNLGRVPASASARRTHLCTVSADAPIFAATDWITTLSETVLLGRLRDQPHRPRPLLSREPHSWPDSISSQIGVPTGARAVQSAAKANGRSGFWSAQFTGHGFVFVGYSCYRNSREHADGQDFWAHLKRWVR